MLRGGTCRSPLSSDNDDSDYGDVHESVHAVASDPEMELDGAPAARAAAPTTTATNRAPRKRKPAPKEVSAAVKKQRASSSSSSSSKARSKKATSFPTIQMRSKATAATPPVVRSAKELIADADAKFVHFLAEQLDERHQAQLATEFGFGQGYLVKTPSPSAWKRTKERARLASWLQALGFKPLVSVSRYLFRIASLRADVILHELHSRVLAVADDVDADFAMATGPSTAASGSNTVDDTALATHESSLAPMRALFRTLDTQTLEIVSLSDADRLLSSARHTEIADAIEHVLAQPSARKEKSRARRRSRLGRLASRRLSLVPLAASTALPALVEDDGEWGDDGDGLDDEANDALASLVRAPAGAARDSVTLSLGGGGDRASSIGSGKWSLGGQRRSSSLAPTSTAAAAVMRESLVMPRASSGRRSSLEPRPLTYLKPQQRRLLLDNVLRLVLHARVVPLATLRNVLRHVSSSWRHISTIVYAWAMADSSNQPRKSMVDVYTDCPRGHYLSDGAYKEVHKVYSTRHKRLEAVSVMDIGAIASTGNESVVRQEIAHTILLSGLVESAFCPNFVQIFGLFVAPAAPRADRWGSAEHRRPTDMLTDRRLSVDPASLAAARASSAPGSSGLFQYIEMEFCDGGDLEDFISLQRETLLPVAPVVVPFFFQMAFSVYCARERFHFRHCDIKLLNFFLKEIARPTHDDCGNRNNDDCMLLQYFVEDAAFTLRLPVAFAYWVKLADYGTAESHAETLDSPVAVDQFTTLENSPIEFLLQGDAATRSFAADTFSLGLALLHLFTGSAPYEVILESVRCPDNLLEDLKRVWTNPRKNSGFSVLRRIVKDDHENVLFHTLYRYLVLFGIPNAAPRGADKVWGVLLKHLRPEAAAAPTGPTRRSRSATASARAAKSANSVASRFARDCAQFSLAAGSDPTIARGRARLAEAPGAAELLASLVHFDPTQRPSMKCVLLHPFFAPLRASSQQEHHADFVVDAYRRSAIGSAALPDV